jgi:hypothetical protein
MATINGNEPQFSDISVYIKGKKFVGITSINYNDKTEPTKTRGTRVKPRGRTDGQYDADGSIEILRKDWPELRGMLVENGRGYMQEEFDIVVNHAMKVNDDIQTDTLKSCRIKSNDRSNSEGGDALKLKLDLDIMEIDDGGDPAVVDPEE